MEPYKLWRCKRDEIPAEFIAVARQSAQIVFGTENVFRKDLQAIGFGEQLIPLTNLYNQLHSTDQSQWSEAIHLRFNDIASTLKSLPSTTNHWAEAEPILRICVRKRSDNITQISQPITQSLRFVLVLSTSDFCVHVTPTHLQSWGITAGDAWQIGLSNNSDGLDFDHQTASFNQMNLEIFTGDLCTTGVLTKRAHQLRPGTSPEKVFVALPTLETVLLLATEDHHQLTIAKQALLSAWPAGTQHRLSSGLFRLNVFAHSQTRYSNEFPQG